MSDIDRIANQKWFHAIDFGEFASAGRFKPGSPQNTTLYGAFEFLSAMNLKQASFLDIGSYDGILSFGVRKLGAQAVTAVDTYRNRAFMLARELLGYSDSDIRYIPGAQVMNLPTMFEPKEFDVIACAGIFYHMLHPMQAFTECRKVLADNGYLIIETPFQDGRDDAALIFNGIEKVVNEPYTYFVPTRLALYGMANLAGYKVIASRVLRYPRRITLLAKAVSREELIESPGTPDFIVQMLKRDLCDDSFRFKDIEKHAKPAADVVGNIDQLAEEREIDARMEKVSFPYHPPLDRPTVGSTRFENEDGNTKVL